MIKRRHLMGPVCALMIVVTQATTGTSFAAQDKPKAQTQNSSTKGISKSSSVPSERPRKSDATATTPAPVRSEGLYAPTKTPPAGVRAKGKSHRWVPAHKKIIPKAIVQPRTDLMHYGILEDPQRYDPRPRADSASVPSPQTPDLAHDHFQELDRNQDGLIDPVEKAFGRIDMDRDLQTRTRQ